MHTNKITEDIEKVIQNIVKTLSQNDMIITQAMFIGYEYKLHVLKCQKLYFTNMVITEICNENMTINMAETLTQFKWE